ncbi:MAG: MFS transporter [Legionellales bacterium]|nr:MFS transporter [Legionellales bacterium]
MQNFNHSYSSRFLWIMWLTAALFYFYECLLQVSPSVMGQNLMRDFHIHAEGLGYLASIYFYAYALMQIPVGMLLDRFGPRRLLGVAALLCGLGCLIFSLASHIASAACGRLLIGIGSSFAAIGCLKIAAIWFPVNRFAIVAGLTVMLGMLGATGGQAPLAFLVDTCGWRETMIVLGIIGSVIAVVLFSVVRDASTPSLKKPHDSLWKNLHTVIKNQHIRLATVYTGLVFAPTPALAALWGVPFLTTCYHFTRPIAAGYISLIYLGAAIGSPLWSLFSNLLGRRRLPLVIGASVSFVNALMIIYLTASPALLGLNLFLFGFSSSSFLLVFAIVRELSTAKSAATALGFANMSTMLGTAILQAVIGYVLDSYWQGTLHHHVRIYSLHDYQFALSIIPICFGLSFFLLPFIRETFCQSVPAAPIIHDDKSCGNKKPAQLMAG